MTARETEASEGLIRKYDVRRLNDATGKHDGCRYFVLDPQHDPLARTALAAYSASARGAGFGPLADDLDTWLAGTQTEAADS